MSGYQKEFNNIPKDWKVKKVSDVSYINDENLKLDEGKYYYYDLSSVQKGKIIHPSTKVNVSSLPSRARRIFNKNDVLISTVRPNLQGFAYIDFQPEDAVCSTGFAVVKMKKGYCPKFLYYNLFTHRIYNTFNRLTVGSNYPALNIKDIENLRIAFPPLEEQQKIASILSTWDEAISLYKRMVEYKKIYRTSLLESFFKDLVLFDKEVEWYEYKLGDIGSFRTSSVDKVNRDEEEEVYILNYMDVYKNPFIDKDLNLEKGTASSTQLKTTDVQKGDIFFTPSSETRDDIGHASIIADELENTVYSYHLVRFRIHTDNVIDKCFAPYTLNNNYVRKQMSRMCTGSTRYTISIKDFEQIMIKLPDLNTQKKMSNIFQLLDKEISYLNKLIIQLQEQKRGLMQLLLTGKVRV